MTGSDSPNAPDTGGPGGPPVRRSAVPGQVAPGPGPAAGSAPGAGSPPLRDLFGEVLRRVRRAQGRTLRDVAEAARVSMPYLSEVERGRKEASSEVLAAICRALGIRLVDLLAAAMSDLVSVEAPTMPPMPPVGPVPAGARLPRLARPPRAEVLPAVAIGPDGVIMVAATHDLVPGGMAPGVQNRCAAGRGRVVRLRSAGARRARPAVGRPPALRATHAVVCRPGRASRSALGTRSLLPAT